VTTEVGFCSFCGRPRTLRSEAHQLGTLVRTIVTCETCHRTLSSTIGVAGAQTEPEPVPAVAEPEPAAERAPAPAKPTAKRKPAAAKSTAPKSRTTKKPK
jgi:hypothetical protein